MFPGLNRDAGLQPTVVSLELKTTPLAGGRAELADVDWSRQRHRKPRNRSFSPLGVDKTAARTDDVSSKRTALTDDVSLPVTTVGLSLDGLPRRHPAATTNRKVAVDHLPPLSNADSRCLVSDVNEVWSWRKSECASRPFEVCALRLNPDIRSTSTAAQFHQQQSTFGVANGNEKTPDSVSATSTSSHHTASDSANSGTKFDTHLPRSDDDEDDEETTEYRYGSNANMTSTSRSTPSITEASCAILSVRIEFCKSRRKHHTDADVDDATPPTTTQSGGVAGGGGERRRQVGRTPTKMKNTKTPNKPTSPSKAISVAGRGKVVVIDDGVYDQFARRHPPKYLTNRAFDAMFNRRVFSKW